MKRNNIKGSAILCFAALIWGLAFVAQSSAADKIPPFAFNAMRSFIGAVFLFGFLQITALVRQEKFTFVPPTATPKTVITGSVICGLMLTVSVNLQQAGISVYPIGADVEARSGFITALYVILVPVFSVILGKKIRVAIWCAVLIALGGLYMLCCVGPNGKIFFADILVLLCAVSFSIHILAVDKYHSVIGGVRLSMLQFIVCSVASSILSLVFEFGKFDMQDVISAAPQILYLGVMSSGIAYTLQIVGQKYAEPAVASISMSLESVFAALGGWIIAGNKLSPTEILGCVLMFAAITLAQTPEFFKKKS